MTHAQLTGLSILHRTNDRAQWQLSYFEVRTAGDGTEVVLIKYKLDETREDEYIVYEDGYYAKL